jgi:osmotically-inducible protein OsmY
LAVWSPSRSDEAIRDDVLTALELDPVADTGEVAVAVRDGEAVLTGRVDSWQEKTLVEIPVKGIPGVRAVVNRLEVDVPSKRADSQMAAEIDQRLAWDVWVTASPVTVAVADGRVTLSGVVGSLAEKERVVAMAWVTGVHSVDANGLVVDWQQYQAHLGSRMPKQYPDTGIEKAIEGTLQRDPRISSMAEITVMAENGVVTLQGVVDVLSASRAAEADARNTAGVWMVENLIKVRPAIGSDYRAMPDVDLEMARKVRLALLLAPGVRQDQVSVTVSQFIAVLEGKVASRFARQRAGDAAAGVRGVVTVINRLEVVPGRVRTDLSDWEIRHDIESELRWSPFVDERDVYVAVDDGTAVLTGVVEDLRARRAATVNARQGGARLVRNHLKVRHGPDFLKP